MKLEEAIQKINQLSRFTFNHEQKALAIRILKRTPQPEIKMCYDFIIQRVKLGFTFDTTTIPNYGQITLVQEQPERNLINAKLSDAVEHRLIIGENIWTKEQWLDNLGVSPKLEKSIEKFEEKLNTRIKELESRIKELEK